MSDQLIAPPFRVILARAEDAIALARQGDGERAVRLATETVRLAPHDANIRHKAGVALYLAGERAAARAHFRALLEEWPEFPYSLLELGNVEHDSADHAAAGDYYARAAHADPTLALAFLRGGAAYSTAGIPGKARALLAEGVRLHPADTDMRLALARCLVFQNAREDAVDHFARAVALRPGDATAQDDYVRTLTETGRYAAVIAHHASLGAERGDMATRTHLLARAHATLALRFDRTQVLAGVQAREASPGWCDAGAAMARLKQAIEQRRAFSLTRWGDGEGRFVVLSAPHDCFGLAGNERDAIGDSIWRNWFGRDLADVSSADLQSLRAAFDGAIRNSDLIGLPSYGRVASDHAHFGYLAALFAHVDSLGGAEARAYTDAFVNMAIHEASPFFADLLSGQPFLGMIGPHEGLAERMAQRLGISETRSYLIAAETRLPDHARPRVSEPHWPNAYRRVMQELVVPFQGAVFVVAAGLLGKIYCARIKELGGIAIDAGSVVDAWAGYNTRPGQYDDLSKWALG